MGGFIMGVLVISALLSIIFGKRVGAVFATGVLGAAGVLVSVCIWLFILVLYTNGFWSYHPKPDLPEYTSTVPEANGYGAGYVPNQAPYYPPSTPTPTYQASGTPTYQAEAPAASEQTAAPTANDQVDQTDTSVPRIGVTVEALSRSMRNVMNGDITGVPTSAGCWITRVEPGGPADNAVNGSSERTPLLKGDFILEAGTQPQNNFWVAPPSELPSILDRLGSGGPVRLHVYRFLNVPKGFDFSAWVYPK